MEPHNPINKIREHRDSLRKSERKVADYILDHSAALINMRIVDVASSAEVSEPTVLRFCRALGYDGFQSFKLQLRPAEMVMGKERPLPPLAPGRNRTTKVAWVMA